MDEASTGEGIEELLLRRREIAGTSVASIFVTVSAADFSFISTHFVISGVFPRTIGKRLARAKHAEVILHIDLFRMIDPSITIEGYLQYLGSPNPNFETPKKEWDTLKSVIEEWGRPFLLFINLGYYGEDGGDSDKMALLQHICLNLPRSERGFVIFSLGN